MSQSIFSAPTNDRHRDFSSSELRDVHGFRGGRFGLDAEQAREVFPEDQIKLFSDAVRQYESESVGSRKFELKFVRLGNSVLSQG